MKLKRESVEFAIKHINKYSDSDFFVKPFEFHAFNVYKQEVINYLITNDVESFPVEPPVCFSVPKHTGGFRIVHQLEPINTIIYTALIYEIANSIEQTRIPKENKISCSYRLALDNKGSFFEVGNGYEDYYEKSMILSNKYQLVMETDIIDFYNQIYLHRLRNSIASCDPNLEEHARVIEEFLLKLNNKVSKGIPVGPAASIILAESS